MKVWREMVAGERMWECGIVRMILFSSCCWHFIRIRRQVDRYSSFSRCISGHNRQTRPLISKFIGEGWQR